MKGNIDIDELNSQIGDNDLLKFHPSVKVESFEDIAKKLFAEQFDTYYLDDTIHCYGADKNRSLADYCLLVQHYLHEDNTEKIINDLLTIKPSSNYITGFLDVVFTCDDINRYVTDLHEVCDFFDVDVELENDDDEDYY